MFAQAAEELTALQSAEQSVNALLATVQEVKPYFATDRERYFASIEESLTTFVDFDEVAIGVMARFAEQATPEQITRFGEKLRVTLTRFLRRCAGRIRRPAAGIPPSGRAVSGTRSEYQCPYADHGQQLHG
jgi:hypothetical protein